MRCFVYRQGEIHITAAAHEQTTQRKMQKGTYKSSFLVRSSITDKTLPSQELRQREHDVQFKNTNTDDERGERVTED